MSAVAAQDPSLSDRERSGEPLQVETLLADHQGELRAYLRAAAGPRLRRGEELEDLAQSVCREILDHRARFTSDGRAGFRRWLIAEAHRKILSRRRALEAECRDAEAADIGSEPASLEEIVAAYRAFTTPSEGAIQREELERVEAALDELPEEQRRVVVLAHLCQWSRAEIAAEMGRGEGAVRMLLHRGIAALAARLTAHENGKVPRAEAQD